MKISWIVAFKAASTFRTLGWGLKHDTLIASQKAIFTVASRVADHPAIHHLSDTEDLPRGCLAVKDGSKIAP